MTRSMLKEKTLPHSFWGEVVSTTVYILNEDPTKTLYAVVREKHVLDQQRKLHDKSEVMILVGYHLLGNIDYLIH